jgi:16S rRNA (cytidine1402-2'-O)-methyltransferase
MFNNSSRNTKSFGRLYIVATPIGNHGDMTPRAIQILHSVDRILAEDTRHSKLFLKTLGIQTPLSSFHAHNEREKTPAILTALQQGTSFALISDAGTPLISDPGFPLVKQAHLLGIEVSPIPGACALIAALSASGIPCDSFTFVGFLPAKKPARREKLLDLHHSPHTLVFYEATHRIKDCLLDISDVFGNTCELVLAKEITKTFERIINGSCETILHWLLEDDGHVKGEFVVIIPPRVIPKQTDAHKILSVLLEELPLKQAVHIATKLTGASKNDLYSLALQFKNNTR